MYLVYMYACMRVYICAHRYMYVCICLGIVYIHMCVCEYIGVGMYI